MVSKFIKRFCKTPELIENYDKAMADITKTWICHHKLEAWFSTKELIGMGKYLDRPARELIFLETEKEHQEWPHKGHSEGYKKLKGRSAWNKGKKTGPQSEEHKAKRSVSMKGNKNAKKRVEQ